MTEGQSYPELRRMHLEPHKLQIPKTQVPNWSLSGQERIREWSQRTVEYDIVDAVKILMPKEDFERMMSIYTAHYHAASRNPAVAEAWHQYRMLVALTEQ